MRLLALVAAAFLALLFAAATRADSPGAAPAVTPLVASYDPPADDPAGAAVRDRAWTYDTAVTAAALAAGGHLDAAGALLDRLQELRRPDGAVEFSYHVSGADGDGPLRSGVQAWAGLAALQWRLETCSGRHDPLLAGLARWLLDRRIPGGLLDGGPDVNWASTEHNLEARAFFAGLAGVLDGSGPAPCQPGLDGLDGGQASALAADLREAVAALDAAIDRELLVRGGGTHFRQGLNDDARPLDVQALGALWLRAQGRADEARAVLATADATMRVSGRTAPGGGAQSFTGYKPFADAWGPDLLWMEGTMQMRLAKARLGLPVADLDDSAARWAAITAPKMPLQADRGDGGDYHAWPAAGPEAWMRLAHGPFSLLG